ncbi:DUF3800 domain-containing protein [Microvirga sp. VF16]|uniref:DUF3800 domain-containing protein n=1 Tax=Microvirga sp. VF16 TaxID=2807101 RepID=UPI00193D7BA3|nr:DUF3800 domain-containing protein [Microvirga sp. VF16]QRM32757.1 DUF3800 domain-containing protein [Microvirga sp. VF16]
MIFAYIDEFGHIGPYFGRSAPVYNESPVFGLAGILLPEPAIRPFASFFLQQKELLFSEEIIRSGKMASQWEKKGTSFLRPRPVEQYPNIRRTIYRMMNRLHRDDGAVFYYGREKIKNRTDLNSMGLYKTILSHAIRKIDNYCEQIGENFALVIDEHSARKELLETAAKTMFGEAPARRLISPPFEVESYLNQSMQAADWIATLVGRVYAHKASPEEFPDYEPMSRLFGDRLHNIAVNSTVMERTPRGIIIERQSRRRLTVISSQSTTVIEDSSTEQITVRSMGT